MSDKNEVLTDISDMATTVAEEEQYQLTPDQMEQFQKLVKDMIGKQNYRECDKKHKVNVKRKTRAKSRVQKQSRRTNRK